MEIHNSPKQEETAPSSTAHRFEFPDEAIRYMNNFAAHARRSLDIFTHTLSPELYCKENLAHNISALARSSAASKVRILVRDARPLHSTRHALVTLARRLPTHVEIKQIVEDTSQANIAFFCVDTRNLVLFNDELTFQGFAREEARVEAKHYTEVFNQLWQHNSAPDGNLRALSL